MILILVCQLISFEVSPIFSPMSLFQSAHIRIALVGLLGVATFAAFKLSVSVNAVTKSGVIMVLPSQVGAFTGKTEELSEGEKHVLPGDTEIVKKSYHDASGNMITAQIVLAGAEKRSIHRPELCLPAQGWSINRRETLSVKLFDGREFSVMNDCISRSIETSLGVMHPLDSFYCYWFVGNGVTTSSHFMRLFLTSWDRIVHRRNHRWAYVVVSAPVLQGFKQGGKNPKETKEMITDFIAEMAPNVMNLTEKDEKLKDPKTEK